MKHLTLEKWKDLNLPENLFNILNEKYQENLKNNNSSKKIKEVTQKKEMKEIEKKNYKFTNLTLINECNFSIGVGLAKFKNIIKQVENLPINLDELEKLLNTLEDKINNNEKTMLIFNMIDDIINNIKSYPNEDKYKKINIDKILQKFPYNEIEKILTILKFKRVPDTQFMRFNKDINLLSQPYLLILDKKGKIGNRNNLNNSQNSLLDNNNNLNTNNANPYNNYSKITYVQTTSTQLQNNNTGETPIIKRKFTTERVGDDNGIPSYTVQIEETKIFKSSRRNQGINDNSLKSNNANITNKINTNIVSNQTQNKVQNNQIQNNNQNNMNIQIQNNMNNQMGNNMNKMNNQMQNNMNNYNNQNQMNNQMQNNMNNYNNQMQNRMNNFNNQNQMNNQMQNSMNNFNNQNQMNNQIQNKMNNFNNQNQMNNQMQNNMNNYNNQMQNSMNNFNNQNQMNNQIQNNMNNYNNQMQNNQYINNQNPNFNNQYQNQNYQQNYNQPISQRPQSHYGYQIPNNMNLGLSQTINPNSMRYNQDNLVFNQQNNNPKFTQSQIINNMNINPNSVLGRLQQANNNSSNNINNQNYQQTNLNKTQGFNSIKNNPFYQEKSIPEILIDENSRRNNIILQTPINHNPKCFFLTSLKNIQTLLKKYSIAHIHKENDNNYIDYISNAITNQTNESNKNESNKLKKLMETPIVTQGDCYFVFPDKYVIKGIFCLYEKISNMYDFIKFFLNNKNEKFILYLNNNQKIDLMNADILSMNFNFPIAFKVVFTNKYTGLSDKELNNLNVNLV